MDSGKWADGAPWRKDRCSARTGEFASARSSDPHDSYVPRSTAFSVRFKPIINFWQKKKLRMAGLLSVDN